MKESMFQKELTLINQTDCHYWYVKEIGYKFQQCVCNKYNDISMITYDLENIPILTVKCVNYRYVLLNRLKMMQLAGKIIPSQMIKAHYEYGFWCK